MEKNFSLTPTVSIGRSKFLRRSQHKTSINLGDIVPIYVDEVLPGDTRNFDIASLIRMSTPIAPIMDDIVMEYMAFFVPNRIVWDKWKEFMGEREVAGATIPAEYTIPKDNVNLGEITPTSMLGYMGIPKGSGTVQVNALPIRSMFAIYNRWFRNQNVQGPVYFSKGNAGVNANSSPVIYGNPDVLNTQSIGDIDSASEMGKMKCFTAYKKADYFTSALPYAQKGTPVALPLGTFAPIVTRSVNIKDYEPASSAFTQTDLDNIGLRFKSYEIGETQGVSVDPGTMVGVTYSSGGPGAPSYLALGPNESASGPDAVLPANLWADLSNATAATINDIRLAFATQKALEKDALYGTRL